MISNIVLIGFMGTGKSTIGRVLSQRLGYRLIDTDAEIVRRCGREIHEIFNEKGEKYFREVESSIIDEVSKTDNVIIACGGGVVKNRDNVRKLKEKGFIVCLKADIDTIYKRVAYDGNRPLAGGKTKKDLQDLLNEREKLYESAYIFIDTTDIKPSEAADSIINAFMKTRQ